MRTIGLFSSLVALMVLGAMGVNAGVVIPVSGGGTNVIGTALAGAAIGDIVEIQDSLVYNEATWVYTLDGKTVRALGGQTPTIVCTGSGAFNGLLDYAGVQNAQLGSNAGGRITIQGNTVDDGVIIALALGAGGGTLRLENLRILGGAGGGVLVINTPTGGGTGGTIWINNCDLDGNGQAKACLWIPGPDASVSGPSIIAEGSRIHNSVASSGFFSVAEINGGQLTANKCVFASFNGLADIVVREQLNSGVVTLDHCDVIQLKLAPSVAVRIDSATATTTMTNCIVYNPADYGPVNFGTLTTTYTDMWAPLGAGWSPGAGDQLVDPVYVGGGPPFDVTPTTPSVLTGDQFGGAMGSMLGTGTSVLPAELSVFSTD